MRRTKSLITLWLMSVVLLAPGIAGAQQPAKSPFDAIQTQLNKLQDQSLVLKDQISKLDIDVNQIKLNNIITLLNSLQSQLDGIQEQNATLQTQIANLPPMWSRQLPASERFVVLAEFNSKAVLDKETGLVWEQLPNFTTFSWEYAQFACNVRGTGGRLGWRLPTFQELASLVDPSVHSGLALPVGHPFSIGEHGQYWSATTLANDTSQAWLVYFNGGAVGYGTKSWGASAWCVRGGQGMDSQSGHVFE